jgi:hypothetical protein
MGVDSMAQLERLTPPAFVAKLFQKMEEMSLASGSPPRRQDIAFLDSVVVTDSIAEIQYRVGPERWQGVHLVKSAGEWRLLWDAVFSLVIVGGREP